MRWWAQALGSGLAALIACGDSGGSESGNDNGCVGANCFPTTSASMGSSSGSGADGADSSSGAASTDTGLATGSSSGSGNDTQAPQCGGPGLVCADMGACLDQQCIDDPYGPCTDPACTAQGFGCIAADNVCAPPCVDAGDCPQLAGFAVLCLDMQCVIPCETVMDCPTTLQCGPVYCLP